MFFYKPCIKIVYAYQKCVCKVCVYIHVYVCIYVDMCMCVYIQLPPEQCRVGVLTPAQSKILLLPQNFSHPSESTKDWFQKYPLPHHRYQNLQMVKSLIQNGMEQCIRSTFHIHGFLTADQIYALSSICDWLNPWILNSHIWRVDYVFIKKNPHIGGSTQFKPMLFKDQLMSRKVIYKATQLDLHESTPMNENHN